MNIRRQWIGILLFGIVAAFVIGCSTPAEPTATPVPPTLPPTEVPTAVVPTQAPTQPPAPAAGGGTLQDALTKVKTAMSYRVDLSITGKGNFASAGGPTPNANAPDQPMTLIVMKGEVDSKDAHFQLQGILTSFLGLPPEQVFEVISVDGEAYLKGPVPLLGATEAKWYKAPAQAASVAEPPLTPGAFLDSFGEAGINPNDFKLSGNESLDGKTCEIYAGDKSVVLNAFSKLGGATGATQEDLDSIDNAEFKFWVCDDGYLHQVRMLIEGHDKNNVEQKGAFEIVMKINDFDADIVITPPPDAIPLNLPTPPAPEATPTP